MIVFRNPGLIDMTAVTTMGVSVKTPGAFGYFGTGMKFAVATILRGGGRITLYRGTEPYVFKTKSASIRGEDFEVVWMNRKPLGFTTQLGRDWEPWMVLRELGCNAMDEGGSFGPIDDGFDPAIHTAVLREGWTTIVVDWPGLQEALAQRGDIFAEAEPLYVVPDKVRILPGPSNHLYYRGVRVSKLEHQSVFRYDILAPMKLTEDRTLAHPWAAAAVIRDTLLACTDTDVLAGALIAGRARHEGLIDFDSDFITVTPSKAFIDAVLDARERRDEGISQSAVAVVLKQMRRENDSERATYVSSRYTQDRFSDAVDILSDLGLEIDLGSKPVVVTDDLPEGVMSMAENGRIYVARKLLSGPIRGIVEQLARRVLDLEGLYTRDEMVDHLLPLLIDTHRDLRSEPDYGEAEAAA